MVHPCIHIYCGDGKGKTTAAIGQAVRAKGAGLSCACFFFLKDGTSSEIPMLHQLGIDTFCAPHSDAFIWQMTEPQKAHFFAAQRDLFCRAVDAIHRSAYDVILLDEILDACALGILTVQALQDLLQDSTAEMILTGRDGTVFKASADYYTQFSAVKHPYTQGIVARKGIEY